MTLLKPNIPALLCALASVLVFAACNDEVFVDRADIDKDVHLSIGGDGGGDGIPYTEEGLEAIDISYSEWCPYYIFNTNSTIVEQSEGNELAVDVSRPCYIDIYARAMTMNFDLRRSGYLGVWASANHSRTAFRATVTFRYGYSRRTVDIVVSGGELYIVESVNPDLFSSEPVVTISQKTSPVFHVNNNGDQAITMPVYPYRDSQATVSIEFADGDDDMINFDSAPAIDVLSALPDGTLCYSGRSVAFRPGTQPLALPEGTEETERTIIVPAHSSVDFVVKLTYVKVVSEVVYNCKLSSGDFFEGKATVTVNEPVDYVIERAN